MFADLPVLTSYHPPGAPSLLPSGYSPVKFPLQALKEKVRKEEEKYR
jgi:hypothetical protein